MNTPKDLEEAGTSESFQHYYMINFWRYSFSADHT